MSIDMQPADWNKFENPSVAFQLQWNCWASVLEIKPWNCISDVLETHEDDEDREKVKLEWLKVNYENLKKCVMEIEIERRPKDGMQYKTYVRALLRQATTCQKSFECVKFLSLHPDVIFHDLNFSWSNFLGCEIHNIEETTTTQKVRQDFCGQPQPFLRADDLIHGQTFLERFRKRQNGQFINFENFDESLISKLQNISGNDDDICVSIRKGIPPKVIVRFKYKINITLSKKTLGGFEIPRRTHTYCSEEEGLVIEKKLLTVDGKKVLRDIYNAAKEQIAPEDLDFSI